MLGGTRWATAPSRRFRPRFSVGGLISGTYRVAWWDTWSGTVFLTQTVPTAVSTLTLALPAPLATDAALQFVRLSDRVHGVDPPAVCRGKR